MKNKRKKIKWLVGVIIFLAVSIALMAVDYLLIRADKADDPVISKEREVANQDNQTLEEESGDSNQIEEEQVFIDESLETSASNGDQSAGNETIQ